MPFPSVQAPPVDTSGLVAKSLVDAKGDILAGTADNTLARKAVGTNGQVLAADSSQSDGLKWANGTNIYPSGIYLLPPGDSGFSAGGMTQSTLVAYPLRIHGFLSVTFASIAVSVTTLAASSSIRLGMYALGTAGAPGALLYDLGTVDSTSTGVKTISSSFSIGPGVVWIAAVAQGGAPSVRIVASAAPVSPEGFAPGGASGLNTSGLTVGPSPFAAASAACTGALPDPFGAIHGTGANMPRFELHIA